jgi:hypothetical protein
MIGTEHSDEVLDNFRDSSGGTGWITGFGAAMAKIVACAESLEMVRPKGPLQVAEHFGVRRRCASWIPSRGTETCEVVAGAEGVRMVRPKYPDEVFDKLRHDGGGTGRITGLSEAASMDIAGVESLGVVGPKYSEIVVDQLFRRGGRTDWIARISAPASLASAGPELDWMLASDEPHFSKQAIECSQGGRWVPSCAEPVREVITGLQRGAMPLGLHMSGFDGKLLEVVSGSGELAARPETVPGTEQDIGGFPMPKMDTCDRAERHNVGTKGRHQLRVALKTRPGLLQRGCGGARDECELTARESFVTGSLD